MEQDEYRGVVRSLVLKLVFGFVGAGLGFYLAAVDHIKFGVLTTAFLGFSLFFMVGGKFFIESTKFIGRRARNYRRAKKGLEPLDVDDEPTAEIISNFQRKS